VSVAGLVPGADVVAALHPGQFDRIVLPRAMFDTEGRQTIDGWTIERMAEALEADVVIASSPVELVAATVKAGGTERAQMGFEVGPGLSRRDESGGKPTHSKGVKLCAAS